MNINYSLPIYKGLYGKIGIGYFKQTFGIIRPFKYDSPIQLLYSTKLYSYSNLQLFAGLGYQKALNWNNSIKCELVYNYYSSFRQKYTVPVPQGDPQINKKALPLGEMINLNFGIVRNVSKKISLGADFIIPIHVHWNKDEMFINNFYSKDEQQIARNKISAGVAVSCYYHIQ